MRRMAWMNPNVPLAGARSALAALLAFASLAAHGESGWYVGLGAAADSQAVTYGKTVYTAQTLISGESTSAESDADEAVFSLGALGGYRWQLPVGVDLSVEADAVWHPNKLEGYLEGTGYTWTDTWPEDWWLRRQFSYGLTLRLGGRLADSGLNLYGLAGLRRVATEFSITETGCPGPELQCPPTPLASFTDEVDRRLSAWTAGAGVERQLGERFTVQVELRRTTYSRKSWDRLFEGGVIIPSTVDGHELGLALRLLRRL